MIRNMTKKEKGNREAVLVYGLAFLLPVLLLIQVWKSVGITYRGEVTLLTFDLQAQYMPFMAWLRNLLKDPGGIFYYWGNSLGGNNMGFFAYYLASPLNWITLLFKPEDMPQAIYVLTLLKTGLCGLSFAVFLRHGVRSGKEHPFLQVLFASCYAMMSYNILYGMCLMWMDGVILLPVILLGVEKMLSGERGMLYVLSLALLLVSNYYITYMVGLFTGAYFILALFIRDRGLSGRDKAKIMLRFSLNTGYAFGLAMPVILPALLNLSLGKGQTALRFVTDVDTGSVLNVFQKFLPMQYDSVSAGKPAIFCGSIVLVFVIVYFCQRRSLGEKIGAGLLLLFPFLGFVLPLGDYVWNGFHEPIGFTYRYAFVFSTALMILAYRAFADLKLQKNAVKSVMILGGIFTMAELYLNGTVLVQGIHKEVNYSPAFLYDTVYALYSPLAEQIKEEDGFYRMGNEREFLAGNESVLFGLNGSDFFASTFHDGVKEFLESMGCQDDLVIKVSAGGGGPFLDSFLGIKYRIGTALPSEIYEEKAKSTVENMAFKLYENKDALSLGFTGEKRDETVELTRDVFANQNLILKNLGLDEVYHKVDFAVTVEEDENPCYEYHFTVPDEQTLYFYPDIYLDLDGQVEISFDGYVFEKAGARQIRVNGVLGKYEPGSEHVIRIQGDITAYVDLYLYSFDEKAYQSAVSALQGREWEIEKFSQGRVEGTIVCDKGANMFYTTIPYDKGYYVLVDGKRVNYEKWMDTFLCIPLESGEHYVKITYCPPGLIPGLVILGLVVILMVADVGIMAKKRTDKNGESI